MAVGPAWRMTPRRRERPGATLLIALVLAVVLTLVELAPAVAGAHLVRSGPRSSGAVALTFDDGYGRSACARIAAILRARKAKGTFFINGIHLKRAPAQWRRILQGQPVGNHTRTHPWLTRLSDSRVRRQIQTNEWIHERILGRPMLKVLRPPYAAQDGRVRGIAGSLGYRRTVLWSRDTRDWSPSATVGSIVASATGAPPGSIILMHCARQMTVEALPAIIRHYRRRGIELRGLKAVLGL